MRVLFLGMRGRFSLPPFAALLASPHEVVAVVVPAMGRHGAAFQALAPPATAGSATDIALLPSYVEQSIVQLAWQQNLPVYEVRRPHAPDFLAFIQDLAPDVACVACFNRILPLALLALPPHGFLNLHPSILPQYRGPEPLFWQLRDGVNPVGVTVHWMDEGLDTGDIAAQTAVPLPDGIAWDALEGRCAEAGAALLVAVLAALEEGRAVRQPQTGLASSQPVPAAEDFALSIVWTAQRAFNFMRGTEAWGVPYRLDGAERQLWLYRAVDWLASGGEPGRVEEQGDQFRIGLAQGVLVAQ